MKHTGKIFLSLRIACFAVLLIAVVLRLGLNALQPASVQAPETAATVSSAEPAEAAEAAQYYPTLLYTPPDHGGLLTAEDTELVSVRNMAGAIYDPEALLTESLDFPLSDEPMILIVHTHATEAYTPADGDDYSAAGSYRTTDTDHNVVRVGQALAQRLNDNGIPTLHDTTLHDVPGYDDAYERAAAVISRYLEEYPSIRMVIDVHRDAALDENGSEVAVNCSIGDREAAQMMLVMGTDAAGLEHPGWQGNLSMALKLQAWCEKTSPGCFRPLQLRAERYNQYLTPYSILLEVGAAGNTLRQALCSAEFFADRLTDLLLQG